MNTKTITINKNEYKIEKMAIGRYADLLGVLETIPEKIAEAMDGTIDVIEDPKTGRKVEKKREFSEIELIKMIPSMLTDSFEELMEILSIGSGIDKDILKTKMGLDDIVFIVQTIFEVNDFSSIKKNLTNIVKLFRNQKRTNKKKTG